MTTVFVGGHGRCNESMSCPMPRGVNVYWFGKLGNPVTKRMSSAILKGDLTTMSGMSSASDPPCQHYTCESVALESEARARAFLQGPWNADTYLIQAKPDFQIPLSWLINFAQSEWPNQMIDFKWAVCRSSVVYSGVVGHDYGGANNVIDKARDNTSPSPVPGLRPITNVKGALYVQRWGRACLNYGSATASQIKNTFGKTETSSGGYILM